MTKTIARDVDDKNMKDGDIKKASSEDADASDL